MLLRTSLIFVLFSSVFYDDARAVIELTQRNQLRDTFNKAICKNAFPDHPMEVWKLGVYEAQITGKVFEPCRGKSLNHFFLSAQSKSLSRKHFHRSHIWGMCPNGNGWVSSWPAPTSMKTDDRKKFSVPYQPLKKYCSRFRIDYVTSAGGQPKQLRVANIKKHAAYLTIDASDLEPGTISVTCYPEQPEWSGPVMWYFAPIKAGPSVSIPYPEELYKTKSLTDNFAAWINAVRTAEGLNALVINSKQLRGHALNLSRHPGLTHDRRQLNTVTKQLAKHKLKFLGENRFRGQSNLEIGWLLWNSPRHRGLILSKQANHLGVGVQSIGRERFGVVIMAQ